MPNELVFRLSAFVGWMVFSAFSDVVYESATGKKQQALPGLNILQVDAILKLRTFVDRVLLRVEFWL